MCPRGQGQDGEEAFLAKPPPMEEKKPTKTGSHGVILVADGMCWCCLGQFQASGVSFPVPSV